MEQRENIYGVSAYNPPKALITPEEYRKRVENLGVGRNLTNADEEFYNELENLRNDLYDMITYDNSVVPIKGTKYYVSTSGDDNADGLTPETAWCSLQKVTDYKLNEGDGVYFKRGDLWRGDVTAQNGVTYQAYGDGPKPKLWNSYDGMTVGNWVKTDMENVWVLDTPLDTSDVGVITFDSCAKYAEKKRTIAEIKANLDFCFAGKCSNQENPDNKLYLRCDGGNPQEVFKDIEISRQSSTIRLCESAHDIRFHNLEVYYGQDYFFTAKTKNIVTTYCFFAWQGGHYFGKNGCRYGGGGGCWHDCDLMEFHHCYFTQQFDCSASPQFNGHVGDPDALFKDFKYHDNLVEYTEYSFEYFNTLPPNPVGTKYDGLYIGYNFMRHGGKGFGDKKHASRYIKGWHADNTAYNTVYEHNIFDRALTMSLEFAARAPGVSARDNKSYDISFDYLPKLRNNIYIEPKDKQYADINYIIFPFNKASQITLKQLGVEENSVFIFSEKE